MEKSERPYRETHAHLGEHVRKLREPVIKFIEASGEKCPKDQTELVKALGNLLVCPYCDIVYIEKENVNNPVGRITLLETETDRPIV